MLSNKLLILLAFHYCLSQEQVATFNLNGTSSITIKNESQQSLKVSFENWSLLPLKSQIIDTIIYAGDSVLIQLITQGNSYFDLKINQEKLKVFSQPYAHPRLTFEESGKILFNGDLDTINQFLANKAADFNSADSDWLPRVNYTHGNGDFIDLIRANDSITSLHRDYLYNHQDHLPYWYVEFENKRLQYLNAHWKLNSLMYRKRMMNRFDLIPDNFLESTIGHLPINDVSMLGNSRYMNFLSDYVGYMADPYYQKEMPASREQWDSFYQELIVTINDQLSGEVRDTYLAFALGKVLDSRKYLFKNHWIEYISDEELKEYLYVRTATSSILPKGSKLPYFNLKDSSNHWYEPTSFTGKIVLINFWATWCKPCIQEFPFENRLVKLFENEPVALVNICLDSEVETWKRFVARYQLKTINLIAEGNWNHTLEKQFGIQALPHSILIDHKGQVVQNKCPRASENVDELILELLEKAKK